VSAPERSADHLIWIDLEFTHLDPTVGGIMQAAMIVTTKDLVPVPPAGVPAEVGGLLYDVRVTAEHAASASEWVLANQSEQLKRSQGEGAVPVEQVQELFVGYLLSACEVPDAIRLRPLLSGNSVHGDMKFVAQHMPKLEALLSFRLLDVTTIKEIARRWAPDLEFNKTAATIKEFYPGPIELEGEAHDALYDIKGSIAELNFYRQRLFVPEAGGRGAAS
jgi:oligoribonuclease